MRVCISGISGFAGSNIAAEFASQPGISVVGIDNMSRRGSWLNLKNLVEFGVEVLHGDIRMQSDVEQVGPIDLVIDAAANASVLAGVRGNGSSRQLFENNLHGTINLLELCAKHAAPFILLSTSRVYSIRGLSSIKVAESEGRMQPTECIPGMTLNGITESFPTSAPVSLYGSSKLASECVALEYGHAFDFPVWINRCGVLAGARQFGKADQGIFSFWLHSWKEGQPLKYIGFNGRGLQVRDCLHPRDLARLLLQQAKASNDGRPQIINVSGGCDSAMSLLQLSEWCARRWGRREVVSDPDCRPFDLPWVVLDSGLATQSWNWRPEITVGEILEEIADFAETQSNWIQMSR